MMSNEVAKGMPQNGLDLSGKHALVTGGGTGLGRQMADALAEAGARVTICGRRAAPLKAAAEAAAAAGHDIRWATADVTDPSDRRRLFDDVKDVDILVNNAALGERKPWLTVTVEEWRAIMNLNLEAPFCAVAAVRSADGREEMGTGDQHLLGLRTHRGRSRAVR